MECLSYGRDPYSVLRTALRGRKRGVSFLFEPYDGHDGVPMTLLWKRGESVDTAIARLRAILVDLAAGRAPRDAMLPCFEGLDHWLPRYLREELIELINDNAIALEQVALVDAEVEDPSIRRQIHRRWSVTSPLRRAAHASLAYLDGRGIDIRAAHLHGRDLDLRDTPYFVGFELRYFPTALRCFERHRGAEGLEVVHPTPRGLMLALRVCPADRQRLARHTGGPSSFFG